jgi:hypothetical protein
MSTMRRTKNTPGPTVHDVKRRLSYMSDASTRAVWRVFCLELNCLCLDGNCTVWRTRNYIGVQNFIYGLSNVCKYDAFSLANHMNFVITASQNKKLKSLFVDILDEFDTDEMFVWEEMIHDMYHFSVLNEPFVQRPGWASTDPRHPHNMKRVMCRLLLTKTFYKDSLEPLITQELLESDFVKNMVSNPLRVFLSTMQGRKQLEKIAGGNRKSIGRYLETSSTILPR